MVDLIDGFVGRNSTEQGLSGRKSSGSPESSVGFQSVLNDVATEDASAYNRSNPRMANTRPDMESGNGLPDSDHNLPSASDEHSGQTKPAGEPVAGGESSDEGASIAVTEDNSLQVTQQLGQFESESLDSGELGALIRLIDSDGTLDSSLPRIPLGTSIHGASLVNGVGVEDGAKLMTTSAQLVGDMTAAAQAKLTPNVVNPDLVSSRAVAGAELDVSLEHKTMLELNRQLLSPQQATSPRLDAATAINQSASGAAPTMVSASSSSSSASLDGIARGAPVLTTGDPEGFSASIATHLRVMKSGGVSEARLQLNPAELGRLSIQIASQDSEVKVSFVVESQQAKQVIENAMPRLRDLLDSAGLDLTESGVDQRNKHADDRNPQHGRQATDSDHFSGDSAQIAMTVTVDPNRLVDAYA